MKLSIIKIVDKFTIFHILMFSFPQRWKAFSALTDIQWSIYTLKKNRNQILLV